MEEVQRHVHTSTSQSVKHTATLTEMLKHKTQEADVLHKLVDREIAAVGQRAEHRRAQMEGLMRLQGQRMSNTVYASTSGQPMSYPGAPGDQSSNLQQ